MTGALLALALGNVFSLGRAAEMEWISPSTFRFRRAVTGKLPELPRDKRAAVEVQRVERRSAVEFRTKYLKVTVGLRTLGVRVATIEGELLAEDRSDPVRQGDAIAWERLDRPGVRYYGLGPRLDTRLDARGKRITASVPLLVSTAGYAEYHAAPGTYTFDLRAGNRIEMRGRDVIDYYFVYGPGPKEVLEELLEAGISIPEPPAAAGDGTWASLRATVASLAHASLSGILAARFEFRPGPAYGRAMQVREYVIEGTRKELAPYFEAYAREAEHRGLPLVRPLAMQFPGDAVAADITDEFMVGDEMLVAPICEPGDERTVYLPMGRWTRLDTNEVFNGRQRVRVRSQGVPVFSRNGSILPLERAVRELHYFPSLGGEFFFYERELKEWSQVHAAPAGDLIRLQIESKVDRVYEWVVHHIDRPTSIGFDRERLPEGKWFYDTARRNLHVRVNARAGEDRILNLWF